MKVLNTVAVNWQTLLTKMGLRQDLDLDLPQLILPVAILDSEVALAATVQPQTLGTPASGGKLASQAANTVLADTGQLAAGNWLVTVLCGTLTGSAANLANFELARRNAGNTADIWAQLIEGQDIYALKITLANNERLVVRNPALSGDTIQASIWTTGPV